MGGIDQESMTSSIGGTVTRAFSTNWGILLPQASLSWVHEYSDDAVSVNGSFIQSPTGTVFSIVGDRPDTDYYNAGVAVMTELPGATSAFLFYNKIFGYKSLDVDTFGVGVRFAL